MSESEKRIPPFGLRLPPELKIRVQVSAVENNRSLNAEIIARLEQSFAIDAGDLVSRDWATGFIKDEVAKAMEEENTEFKRLMNAARKLLGETE